MRRAWIPIEEWPDVDNQAKQRKGGSPHDWLKGRKDSYGESELKCSEKRIYTKAEQVGTAQGIELVWDHVEPRRR